MTIDDAVSQRLAGTDAGRALNAAYTAAWACADPALLTVCRDRVGMLLRHTPTIESMTAADRERLLAWPSSEHVAETERAALDFTEQYVVDVSGITDEQAARLRDALGDEGFATFVNALLVIEQRMTLDLVLGAVA